MQTFSTKAQLRAALLKHHRKHDHVVLVPTMGALHAGHRALLEQARKLAGEDGVVVASIFVNPIQFNNSSDLQTYPRTPEKDLEVCEGAGVDYVFSPASEEMYSGERSIAVEESFLSATLCGASRPGHFSGVCTVLAKLFNLVQPTDAIFGKKIYILDNTYGVTRFYADTFFKTFDPERKAEGTEVIFADSIEEIGTITDDMIVLREDPKAYRYQDITDILKEFQAKEQEDS